MSEPQYLVQRPDGVLCAYWRPDILRYDLITQPDRHLVKIFKKAEGGLTLQYRPITSEEVSNE